MWRGTDSGRKMGTSARLNFTNWGIPSPPRKKPWMNMRIDVNVQNFISLEIWINNKLCVMLERVKDVEEKSTLLVWMSSAEDRTEL